MKLKLLMTACIMNSCMLSAVSFAAKDNTNWNINISSIPASTNIQPYTYSRADQPYAPHYDWENVVNQKPFNQLITFAVKSSGALPANSELTITKPVADTTDNCAELFFQRNQVYVPLNKAFNLSTTFPQLSTLKASDPIHLTAIPYKSTAKDYSCVAPTDLPADKAIAIWISNDTGYLPDPDGAYTCTYQADPKITSVDDLPLTPNSLNGTTNCAFVRPQWSMIKRTDTKGVAKYYLKYSGTMAWMIAQKKPIVIKIPQGQTVPFPITSEYVLYPTGVKTDSDMDVCNSDLATYNASNQDPNTTTFPASCHLDSGFSIGDKATEAYQRSYTYSEPMAYPIYIEGLGRIDGSATINKYVNNAGYPANRPCKISGNLGSIAPCEIPGLPISSKNPTIAPVNDFIRFAQWRIDTSLLGLSSTFPSPDKNVRPDPNNPGYQGVQPAIYINGITVSNPPKRNRSVVQLNVAQFGLEYAFGGRPADNTTVLMNDFKEVGAWMDATDGPDVGSDHANEQNLYYQINDDSAKLEAQYQYVNNVTLLQGGVGGIMLGMYGVTRDNIYGSIVSNVAVPRITQLPSDVDKWNWYNSTHGLVSTRTCPRLYQGGNTTVNPKLGNAEVNGVRVFALTDLSDPSVEPNYIDTAVSAGVFTDSQYCGIAFDSMNLAPQITFGPFDFWNIVSDIPAQHPFVLYDKENGYTHTIWNKMDFGSLKAGNETRVNDLNDRNSYLCPFNSSNPFQHGLKCMFYQPSTKQSIVMNSNVANVTYLPEETALPIDKTTFINFPYETS